MIEVTLCGDYLGVPHEVGAWAYLVRCGGELLGEGRGSDRPQIITSRLATEAAALALALEDVTRTCHADDVLIRTISTGLEGLLVRRGAEAPRDVSRWYQRLRAAAALCSSVRVLRARPDELGSLRAIVQDLLPNGLRRSLDPQVLPARSPEKRAP